MTKCPVCFDLAAEAQRQNADLWQISCPRCGVYEVVSGASAMLEREQAPSDDVPAWLGARASRQRANASAFLREHPGHRIYTTGVAELARVEAPPVSERADRLLRLLEEKGEGFLGRPVDLVATEALAPTWSVDDQELGYLVTLLERAQRIKEVGTSAQAFILEILPAGWERLERLRETNPRSTQGFIAMSFAPGLSETCEKGLRPAIRDAGYEPHRVDDREHPGRIDDEIILQLRRSRFVVADFTEHRPGVYYEAGFAHALGLPVFFTMRGNEKPLHFDVRQFNTILWNDTSDLRERLARRIEATIGRGPLSPGSM